MKIDFHLHGKLSKKVDFSKEYLINMVQEARKEGLNALSLTEHFNTHHFFEIYNTLDQNFEYRHSYYDVNGFHLFPGMEVDVQEGGHILLIGDREDVRSVRKVLQKHEEEKDFIKAQQLIEICKAYELLKIGAHPLRSGNTLNQIPKEILYELDAFDLNGKDLNGGGHQMKEAVYEFAKQVGLPVVGGSDSHHFLQVGSIYNDFKEECDTVQQIKNSIQKGNYEVIISEVLKTKVSAAELAKKELLEEILRGMPNETVE